MTDAKRLQQVIKNLLSNAFKFTRRGRVSLEIRSVPPETFRDDQSLRKADSVLAFVVADTGIGIPLEKQQIIFEAFQQADGSTSRKYGGTGLGLAISREIARLLGGEIHLASAVALFIFVDVPRFFLAPDVPWASTGLVSAYYAGLVWPPILRGGADVGAVTAIVLLLVKWSFLLAPAVLLRWGRTRLRAQKSPVPGPEPCRPRTSASSSRPVL